MKIPSPSQTRLRDATQSSPPLSLVPFPQMDRMQILVLINHSLWLEDICRFVLERFEFLLWEPVTFYSVRSIFI